MSIQIEKSPKTEMLLHPTGIRYTFCPNEDQPNVPATVRVVRADKRGQHSYYLPLVEAHRLWSYLLPRGFQKV